MEQDFALFTKDANIANKKLLDKADLYHKPPEVKYLGLIKHPEQESISLYDT